MTKKSIMEQMAEIIAQAHELDRLSQELVVTPNKIWLPGKGIVTLWETKK